MSAGFILGVGLYDISSSEKKEGVGIKYLYSRKKWVDSSRCKER
jgi:hypothetical protein